MEITVTILILVIIGIILGKISGFIGSKVFKFSKILNYFKNLFKKS